MFTLLTDTWLGKCLLSTPAHQPTFIYVDSSIQSYLSLFCILYILEHTHIECQRALLWQLCSFCQIKLVLREYLWSYLSNVSSVFSHDFDGKLIENVDLQTYC